MPVATDWAPWASHVPSVLWHHGAECCTVAQAWFRAMDRSMWRGDGAPAWIRARYDWGPTRWPLYWCDAVGAEELDCGAQAALAIEAFRGRGVDAVPVQLVQRYDVHDVPHWHRRWTECGASPGWAAEGLVYHEACAVITDGRARVWNPTATSWASPENVRGYGSIVAVRIGGATPTGRTLAWGGLELPFGAWASPRASAPGAAG